MPLADRHGSTSSSVTIRQMILWTGALAVIPLLFYPGAAGLMPFRYRPVMVLIECALYFVLLIPLASWLTVSKRMAAAVFTLAYRYLCGVASGSLLAAGHDLSWVSSVKFALWSFPPLLILQVAAAPFVIRVLLKSLWGADLPRPRIAGFRPSHPVHVPRMAGGDLSKSFGSGTDTRSLLHRSHLTFDNALAYVGAYDGVRISWLVDAEGLPLAVWQRQEYTGSVDFWAPISIEIVEFNRRCLSAAGEVTPQRVEVRTDAGRIILEAVGELWLGVLTNRDADDLIGLRLSQSRDMILKHLQERCVQSTGLQEARYV